MLCAIESADIGTSRKEGGKKDSKPKIRRTKPRKMSVVPATDRSKSRLGANAHDIRYAMFQTQHAYYKKFPNARQHICAIPPTSQINHEVNKELGNLAQATGVNFISTKNLCDPMTKSILPSLIQADKLHYTHEGIKMVARQIKRSIWSTNNKVRSDGLCPLQQQP